MKTDLSQFFDALTLQESKFIPTFAADNFGVLLRAAINELDWYYYNLSRSGEPTEEQEEQFYLLRLGVSRLIKLALDARPSFDAPTVMFLRDKSRSIPVLEIIGGLGMIEHGRRVAQTVSTGFCSIEQIDVNEFLITLPTVLPDEEYYERALSNHYRAESQKKFSKILESDFGKKIQADVEKKLDELVYPFAIHFIGYGGDPILDTYFFGIAFSQVQLYDGYDTFNYSIRFGGIQFQKYILALTYFICISIRHERFAEALVKKVPNIKLENILTISSATEGFIESIKDAVNFFGAAYEDFEDITLDEARRIFEVLSCSRKNSELLARPSSALPIFIQCSDTGFIRSLTGSHAEPMRFLLDSLRHNFPSEYDKHQQTREKSMQTAIKRVLNEGFVGLKYMENIKIRLGGRVITDIDLVIIEEITGTVILCQLKHQELYGSDVHAKHVRTVRLKDQIGRWLVSVDEWITSVGEAGIRAALRLDKNILKLSPIRLVISRHYGYPLKHMAQNADTSYANWVQFFNSMELLKRERPNGRQLNDLVAMLKKMEEPGGPREHRPEPRTEWIVDDLKFTIR